MLSCIVRMKVSRYFEDYFDNACTQVCVYTYASLMFDWARSLF